MRMLSVVALLVSAQDVTVVTLADVLLFDYPGVEWTLETPAPPEEPSITLWKSTEPQPTIEALEQLRDNPSAELLEAVRTGEFPQPPAEDGK